MAGTMKTKSGVPSSKLIERWFKLKEAEGRMLPSGSGSMRVALERHEIEHRLMGLL